MTFARGSWALLLAVAGCAAHAPASAPSSTPAPVAPSSAARMGLASMEYGEQFVVVCKDDDRALFRYLGPECPRVAGMSFDIHRSNWASSYLNYDDPSDPANAGLLSAQRYVSLQLADLAGYKALALLKAYDLTGEAALLERFRRLFLRPILDKQLPSAALRLGATQTFQAAYAPDPRRDVTLDATGAFASSATLAAGADDVLGTTDDVLTWRWNGYSAFQLAALAEAIAAYAERTGDAESLAAADRAGRFLLRLEQRAGGGGADGSWSYGIAPAGGGPSRFATAVVARALSSLSRLDALPGARDFRAGAVRAARWSRRQPLAGLDPVSAGAEIDVLLDAGRAADATPLADALLARVTTPRAIAWGDHRYDADPHAIGGVASPWGSGSFQSPWFATYNVGALLRLAKATRDPRYATAADLVVGWLADKLGRSERDREVVSVLDLRGGVTAIRGGTWWGLFPEAYEPNAGTYPAPGGGARETIPGLVLLWVKSPFADARPPSWLEEHAGVDLERVLYDGVRRDPYYAHVTSAFPWRRPIELPRDLGEVAPAINPLLADDAALAFFDYALLREAAPR